MIRKRYEVRSAHFGSFMGLRTYVDLGGEPVSRHFTWWGARREARALNDHAISRGVRFHVRRTLI